MNRYLLVTVGILIAVGTVVRSGELSLDAQRELLVTYGVLTGQIDADQLERLGVTLPEMELPIKCGTPLVMTFWEYRDRFDKQLMQSLGVVGRPVRPSLDQQYGSPAGRFLIHYTKTGSNACFQPTVDSDNDGTPDYIESIGVIADSVWDNTIQGLKYPAPPSDSFYPDGGDYRYDIYLRNEGGQFFGLTFGDSIIQNDALAAHSTSFMELDNDYQERTFSQYNSRPLDAARVTIAHEFFHSIHFAMDFRENEAVDNDNPRQYWMEMSATWMEEQLYDDINDYYTVLKFFFDDPGNSIQQFKSFADLHPYGSMLFALYLSENYGPNIINVIWQLCENLGPGPSFLVAADSAIKIASGGSATFQTSFSEFALWNFFTGNRSDLLPAGVDGYPERHNYPQFPDDKIGVFSDYEFVLTVADNQYNPEHNSASYFKFDQMQAVVSDSVPPTFEFFVGLDPSFKQSWGLDVVFQFADQLDSLVVDRVSLPQGQGQAFRLVVPDPNQYRSITYIFTPASNARLNYRQGSLLSQEIGFGLLVDHRIDSALLEVDIDSGAISIPPAVLLAYPNPAVVSEMGGGNLTFQFQVPTDSLSDFILQSPYFTVDVFDVAGQLVRTIDEVVTPEQKNIYLPGIRDVLVEIDWDMNNRSGNGVASGAYVGIARLYDKRSKGTVLAEGEVKLLLVR